MWRLWTRGWGFKSWWSWMVEYAIPMRLAWWVPRYVAYWVYIRVQTASNDGCSRESAATMNAWQAGAGK